MMECTEKNNNSEFLSGLWHDFFGLNPLVGHILAGKVNG